MKKTLFLTFLSLIAANACSQVLFSVNGKELKGESYLLFVDNMLPTSSLIGVKDVFKSYNRTDVVICEYNEEESWDKLQKLLMDSTSRLSDAINYTDIGMVDSVLRTDSRLSLSKVEQIKPGAVRMMWKTEICRSLYARGDEDMAMDSYFQQVAQIEGKRIVALDDTVTYDYVSETIEAQARRMVSDFRNGRDSIAMRYHTADSLFRAGDVKSLASLQTDDIGRNEVNARWIDRIIATMTDNRSFLVLPAKYFDGELFAKLKKQGLKIKEVK